MLAGAGHGWTTPLIVSIPLWVLYPLTLYAAKGDIPHARLILLALAIIAVASDALLVSGTIGEFHSLQSYLQVNGIAGVIIITFWAILWLAWQAMILRALLWRTTDNANA